MVLGNVHLQDNLVAAAMGCDVMMFSDLALISLSIVAIWWGIGDYRDDSEAWYEVVAEGGVELLERPDKNRARLLELFLPGKVMFYHGGFVYSVLPWIGCFACHTYIGISKVGLYALS